MVISFRVHVRFLEQWVFDIHYRLSLSVLFSEAQKNASAITVGINPVLSDLNTPRTSRLGWRYFEANKIDRNELHIRNNSQKGTRTKMTEKLNNFEKFERKKKSNFSPVLNPETS